MATDPVSAARQLLERLASVRTFASSALAMRYQTPGARERGIPMLPLQVEEAPALIAAISQPQEVFTALESNEGPREK